MTDQRRGVTSPASTPGSFAPHERTAAAVTLPAIPDPWGFDYPDLFRETFEAAPDFAAVDNIWSEVLKRTYVSAELRGPAIRFDPDLDDAQDVDGVDNILAKTVKSEAVRLLQSEVTTGEYIDYDTALAMRWSAVHRGRRLRLEGAPVRDSALPESNPFRHAQNRAELDDLYSLATEEPPGDGEASRRTLFEWGERLDREYAARLAELRA